jgi:ABC-type glycerol-3-phosphate transport system substrate-binding protein
MGLRGILQNLREFDDFSDNIGYFPPGALLRFIVEDRVYGLPETMDFNVLFYRRDIVDSLGLTIPETWEDVAEMMPELHRHGLNFYTGLSGAAYKPLSVTAPFIWQNGGELFTPDGMRTDIDSAEAVGGIRRMLNLSAIYGMSLRIPSFYQSFRNGSTPFGVAGFDTYMELMLAAPELLDSWNVTLPPGVRDADGVVQRQYMGVGTSNVIFSNSPNTNAAWELLKWYMSDDIQKQFTFQLATAYGTRLVFNTANIEAFRTISIKPDHIDIITEQLMDMRELQMLPGHYMLERTLSFLWNTVVFDNTRPMDALDSSVTTTNREIMRRMREFGFVEGTTMVRPFPIWTNADIEGWRSAP